MGVYQNNVYSISVNSGIERWSVKQGDHILLEGERVRTG
jgi:hypothetical protein